jgi:hypothetical protein
MNSSDKNIIQPGRNGPDRPSIPSIFVGTVTGIKQENGIQTLEVNYSQGKVRFNAEGEFQSGEKVRISFPGGNAVQVAKSSGPHEQQATQGAGYTLPQNAASLHEFEEKVSQWIARATTNSSGNPNATSEVQNQVALAKLTMPELLLKVMTLNGGKDFLSQAFTSLDRSALNTLLAAVEASKVDQASKSGLLDILKSLGQNAAQVGDKTATAGPKNLDGFWSVEAGTGASPWFGRVLEKSGAESFMSPLSRLQYGGGEPPKNDPMFRYLLDVGGRTMEVFSAQSREKGELTDFNIEAHGGRMQAKFMDPASAIPNSLRSEFATSAVGMRQAMQLSSHYLQDFKDEPYFGKLVKDFSEVLSQSGRMQAGASAANGARPAGLPDQKELDGLLRLFLTYPRDGTQPEKQAKAWGDAVRNPEAMKDFLKTMRPDQGAALLRSGTELKLNPGMAGAPLGDAEATSPEALARWLKKALPEGFKAADLHRLAEDNSGLASTTIKDQDASKFLLQAVANTFPKDDDLPQGKSGQFYFYQGQEWKGLQVTWEKGRPEANKGKAGPKEPLKVRVETDAKHLGKVTVGVTLDIKGAKIDFKNQFYDVRDIFTQSLPELEKSLEYLDFKVAAWTYAMLPEENLPPAPSNWIRPAGLSDGNNLDLVG